MIHWREVPMPEGVKALPVDPARDFPVPWFVQWLDGKPEFRIADRDKLKLAVAERRCWVCGRRLDNRCTYLIGPMCAVNRISGEPPSHPACAEYSVRTCPFLSRPSMDRREGGLPAMPEGGCPVAGGFMIERNPGVTLLWTGRTPGSTTVSDGRGGVAFQLHDPLSLTWWAEGRAATKAEVAASIESGVPLLRAMCDRQGEQRRLDAHLALDRAIERAQPLLATIGAHR